MCLCETPTASIRIVAVDVFFEFFVPLNWFFHFFFSSSSSAAQSKVQARCLDRQREAEGSFFLAWNIFDEFTMFSFIALLQKSNEICTHAAGVPLIKRSYQRLCRFIFSVCV